MISIRRQLRGSASTKALGLATLAGAISLCAITTGALADTVNFGGGTITLAGVGNPIQFVDTSNNLSLANSAAAQTFTFNGVTAGNVTVANNQSIHFFYPSTFTLNVHGSNLGTISSGASGFGAIDTTGGAGNTLSGIYLTDICAPLVFCIVSNTTLTIATGADTITAAGDAISANTGSSSPANVTSGSGPISIDSVGAKITSANGNGIYAGTNTTDGITIGGRNGGIASTIIAPNGWGIKTYSTAGANYWPGSATLAPSGLIMAKGGIQVANVDTYGTIIATSDPAITGLNVTLESGSITEGTIWSPNLAIKPGAIWVTGTTQSLAGIANGSGVLVFNQASNTTFSGNIMAAAGLQQKGAGKLTLTGTNTFTGPITIATGSTLQVGDGGANGTISGDVTDNGTLIFNSSNSFTYTGAISGSGSVDKLGTGTLTLSGLNSYTGGTTVEAGTLILTDYNYANTTVTVLPGGTLQVGNGTITGTLTGDHTITGTLALSRSDDYTYSGVLSGTGGLNQIGPGKLILTGNNTFTGTMAISGGTLQIGNGGTTGAIASTTIVDNATLTFNRSDTITYAGVISGMGGLQQNGSGTLILTGANTYAGGTTIGSGSTLQIGNGGTSGSFAGNITNNGTLVFNHSDTYTYGGQVTGGALVQNGSGILILNGFSSLQSATVSNGTLEIGDASHTSAGISGGVTVNSSGILMGHGTIGGAVTNNGTVAPGGSIGTLTVGSYSQGPTGTLDVEVGPANSDLLSVTGTVSLAGTLKLEAQPGVAANANVTFLRAQSISGTFTTVNVSGLSADETVGVAYSSSSATAIIASKQPAAIYSDFNRASFDLLAQLGDETTAHYLSASCTGSRAHAPNCAELSYWRQAIGGVGSYGRGADQFNRRFAGGILGVDYRSEDGSWLGLTASYVRTALRLPSATGSVDADTFAISANGGTPMLGGRLFAHVIYAQNNGDAKRPGTTGTGSPGTAASHPQNEAFGATAGYDRPLVLDIVHARALISYAGVQQHPLSENGLNPYDFTALSQTKSSVYADLSLTVRDALKLDSGALIIPEFEGGVRAMVSGRDQGITAMLADATGPSFAAPGVSQPAVAFIGGIGVSAEKPDAYAMYVKLRGRLGPNVREGVISVGGTVRF